MEEIQTFKITASIKEINTKEAPNLYPISIRVINDSSVDFRLAEVTVQDTDSRKTAKATFSNIHSGGEDRTTVQLPGGIELCVWQITPVVGEVIRGGGAAANAPGVDLTITD